jgi:hypothetical protein
MIRSSRRATNSANGSFPAVQSKGPTGSSWPEGADRSSDGMVTSRVFGHRVSTRRRPSRSSLAFKAPQRERPTKAWIGLSIKQPFELRDRD